MDDGKLDARQSEHQQWRWERAITVSILAVTASGILTFAAQDTFFPPSRRRMNYATACIGNLKTIEGAKATWALENNQSSNAIPADAELFGETKYIREKPACPKGGKYTIGSVVQRSRCSIPGHTI